MNKEAALIKHIKNLCEEAINQLELVEIKPNICTNTDEELPIEIKEDDLRNIKFGDFSLGKISFLGSDKTVFPERIHVDKWVSCEPYKVYSLDKEEYIMMDKYSYAVAELIWDSHEPCWDLKSVGPRFLEVATEDLCKWLLDFCENYYVKDGKLWKGDIEEDY